MLYPTRPARGLRAPVIATFLMVAVASGCDAQSSPATDGLVVSSDAELAALAAELLPDLARRSGMELREPGKADQSFLFDLKGRVDDGPNLLDEPLSEEAKKARAKLEEALAEYRRLRPENP